MDNRSDQRGNSDITPASLEFTNNDKPRNVVFSATSGEITHSSLEENAVAVSSTNQTRIVLNPVKSGEISESAFVKLQCATANQQRIVLNSVSSSVIPDAPYAFVCDFASVRRFSSVINNLTSKFRSNISHSKQTATTRAPGRDIHREAEHKKSYPTYKPTRSASNSAAALPSDHPRIVKKWKNKKVQGAPTLPSVGTDQQRVVLNPASSSEIKNLSSNIRSSNISHSKQTPATRTSGRVIHRKARLKNGAGTSGAADLPYATQPSSSTNRPRHVKKRKNKKVKGTTTLSSVGTVQQRVVLNPASSSESPVAPVCDFIAVTRFGSVLKNLSSVISHSEQTPTTRTPGRVKNGVGTSGDAEHKPILSASKSAAAQPSTSTDQPRILKKKKNKKVQGATTLPSVGTDQQRVVLNPASSSESPDAPVCDFTSVARFGTALKNLSSNIPSSVISHSKQTPTTRTPGRIKSGVGTSGDADLPYTKHKPILSASNSAAGQPSTSTDHPRIVINWKNKKVQGATTPSSVRTDLQRIVLNSASSSVIPDAPYAFVCDFASVRRFSSVINNLTSKFRSNKSHSKRNPTAQSGNADLPHTKHKPNLSASKSNAAAALSPIDQPPVVFIPTTSSKITDAPHATDVAVCDFGVSSIVDSLPDGAVGNTISAGIRPDHAGCNTTEGDPLAEVEEQDYFACPDTGENTEKALGRFTSAENWSKVIAVELPSPAKKRMTEGRLLNDNHHDDLLDESGIDVEAPSPAKKRMTEGRLLNDNHHDDLLDESGIDVEAPSPAQKRMTEGRHQNDEQRMNLSSNISHSKRTPTTRTHGRVIHQKAGLQNGVGTSGGTDLPYPSYKPTLSASKSAAALSSTATDQQRIVLNPATSDVISDASYRPVYYEITPASVTEAAAALSSIDQPPVVFIPTTSSKITDAPHATDVAVCDFGVSSIVDSLPDGAVGNTTEGDPLAEVEEQDYFACLDHGENTDIEKALGRLSSAENWSKVIAVELPSPAKKRMTEGRLLNDNHHDDLLDESSIDVKAPSPAKKRMTEGRLLNDNHHDDLLDESGIDVEAPSPAQKRMTEGRHQNDEPVINIDSTKMTEVRHKNEEHHMFVCAKTKRYYEGKLAQLKSVYKAASEKTQQLAKENERLKQLPNKALEALHRVFQPDQVQTLVNGLQRPARWSNDTLTDAIKLKLACGTKGYEELRGRMPMPSESTLSRKLSSLEFNHGIAYDMLQILRARFEGLPVEERYCGIVYDEMQIQDVVAYNPGGGKFVGHTTFPPSNTMANHALVFMMVGLKTRWKQTVAYQFTGNKIPPGLFAEFVVLLVKEVERICGVRVLCLTADCCSANRSVWEHLGVRTDKESALSCQPLCHPTVPDAKIEIIPDVVHIFKSVVNGWKNNLTMKLPEYVLQQYNLQHAEAKIIHILDMIKWEKSHRLKAAHKVREEDFRFLTAKNSLAAMRVPNSYKFVCMDMAHSLRYYAVKANRPEVLTTALFVEIVATWFQLCANRSRKMALSKKKPDMYTKATDFLNFYIRFVTDLRCGCGHKPWQSNSAVATRAILRLVDFLLNNGYDFVLTGYFTQDCIENLFSNIRRSQKKPSASQFRNILKLLSVGQYLREVPSSSYDFDGGSMMLELDMIDENRKRTAIPLVVDTSWETNLTVAEAARAVEDQEKDVLYHLSGYCVRSVISNGAICKNCLLNIESPQDRAELGGRDILTTLKDFTGSSLVYVNEETYGFFLKLEAVFRRVMADQQRSDDVKEILSKKLLAIPAPHLASCHNIREKFIRRFLELRLKTWEPKRVEESLHRKD